LRLWKWITEVIQFVRTGHQLCQDKFISYRRIYPCNVAKQVTNTNKNNKWKTESTSKCI